MIHFNLNTWVSNNNQTQSVTEVLKWLFVLKDSQLLEEGVHNHYFWKNIAHMY